MPRTMPLTAFSLSPVPQLRAHRPARVCMRANPTFNHPPDGIPPMLPTPGTGAPTSSAASPPVDTRSPPPPPPVQPFDEREERDDGAPVTRWAPLQRRLRANPRLPLQLGVELLVGGVSKTIAEVQDRRERFFHELERYVCNLSLELVGDAMLVWLLCPVAGGAMRAGALGGGLPKHFLQVGAFSAAQRAAGFVWKGVQFGMVGCVSSAVGQTMTRGLIKGRGGDVGKLPRVVPNSLAWGGFMMVSSNARYQLINGFEQRVLERVLPRGALGAGVTFVMRFANCYVGGVQWLPWARFFGVQ